MAHGKKVEFLGEKPRGNERDLVLSSVVDLAVWLAEIDCHIEELSMEIERLRRCILRLGVDSGLE